MKKLIRPLIFSLIFFLSMAIAPTAMSQDPPPPPPSGKGTSGNQSGGGAPIDGGLAVSLAMIACFGGWKLLKMMKKSVKPSIFPLVLLVFMAVAQVGLAQSPPPPPSAGEKGSSGNKAPGGGAPIDAGLTVSVAMIACFGGWKLFNAMKNQNKVID